jgi:CRP/FNR family transcriptional regulator
VGDKDSRVISMNMSDMRPSTGSGSPPRCDQCSTRGRCLFAETRSAQNDYFRSLVRERSVSVGETVEAQGSDGHALSVVKVGLLKGIRTIPGGDDGKSIMLMGKGRLVGFTQPFGQSAMLSMVAITPTRLCQVNVQDVKDIAMPNASFQQAIYRTSAAFLSCMADWSRLLREDSYLQKVSIALQLIAVEEGSQAFRIPSHRELANVLGTRRETIARHISILIEKGMLRKIDRWHVMLALPGDDGHQQRVVEKHRT